MSVFHTRLRTNVVAELADMSGASVALCGWVSAIHPLGQPSQAFELVERTGSVLVRSVAGSESSRIIASLKVGDVLRVAGTVARTDGQAPVIQLTSIERLNRALSLPYNPWKSEPTRLSRDKLAELRHLELRRSDQQRLLELRSRALTATRSQLFRHGFLEVELPILDHLSAASTAAYPVPVDGGRAFALSSTPQLYKQLLIGAGADRFFQFSRVFRRERAFSPWHQPEYTSLDVEMAFAEESDLYSVVEEVCSRLVKGILNKELSLPIPRMTYDEAMLRYGSETPDLRFGLELHDIGDLLEQGSNPYILEVLSDSGLPQGAVRAFRIEAKLAQKFPARRLELLPLINPHPNQTRLDWLQLENGGTWDGSLDNCLAPAGGTLLAARLGCSPGDVLIIISGMSHHFVARAAGEVRIQLASELSLIGPAGHAFAWVEHFPYFSFDPETRAFVPARHALTQPLNECVPFFDSVEPLSYRPAVAPDLEEPDGEGGGTPPANLRARVDYSTELGLRVIPLRSRGFELVLNGKEVGSGSVRIHDAVLQEKVLSMFGFSREEASEQYGALLAALRHGMPPHVGLAIGIDRVLALLSGGDGISGVVPFPKNSRGECPVSNSPSRLDATFIRSLLGVGERTKMDRSE